MHDEQSYINGVGEAQGAPLQHRAEFVLDRCSARLEFSESFTSLSRFEMELELCKATDAGDWLLRLLARLSQHLPLDAVPIAANAEIDWADASHGKAVQGERPVTTQVGTTKILS